VRYKGYQRALQKNSLKLDKKLVLFRDYSKEAGEEMMEALLSQDTSPGAVFCINNLVFFGAMKVVQSYEKQHKRSIMMSGFDIAYYADIFKRALISADQDMEKLASAAVSLLIDRIKCQERKEYHIIIPISVKKHRL
jgi:DNA-binding LacI/PurR family transcriptional regulator